MTSPPDRQLPPPQDWRAAARLVARELGPDAMKDLLAADRRMDVVNFVTILAILVGLAASATVAPTWLLPVIVLLQGAALQASAIIGHDLFVHRKVGGPFWSWIGSMMTFFPTLITPTLWGEHHLYHHRHNHTVQDQNDFDDLNNRWRKLLFLTLPGLLLAASRKLTPASYKPRAMTFRDEFLRLYGWNKVLMRRHRIESALTGLLFIGLVAGSFWWPRLFLWGWLLPLTVAAPLWNGVRQATEHAFIDLRNDFHQATMYRPGFVLNYLFYGECGERHIVHHLFPSIPNYRRNAATDLIGPILRAQGVEERRSWWRCVYDYFILAKERFHFTTDDGRTVHLASLLAPPEEWRVEPAFEPASSV
jgi:fatty acid desaturase